MQTLRYIGRDESAVEVGEEFAETAGVPVVQASPVFDMNFPHHNQFHGGFDPSEWIDGSDLVFVVNCDIPWQPSQVELGDDTSVIHIDPDATKPQYPLWGFRPDVSITADVKSALNDLTTTISDREYSVSQARIDEMTEQRRSIEGANQERVGEEKARQHLTPAVLSDEISRVISDQTVVVSELVSNSKEALQYLERSQPGTDYSTVRVGWDGEWGPRWESSWPNRNRP